MGRNVSGISQKWDLRYLDLAKHISTWSKDPSTKIGSIAIGKNGQVLSQGYNGFPRGVIDSTERLKDREKKLARVVHAEMNVIYNASANGVTLKGSTLYIHGLPCCSDCAKGMIQAGIYRVVMHVQKLDGVMRWQDSWNRSKAMFDEAGVKWNLNGIKSK